MFWRMFLKSLFKFRNLGILIALWLGTNFFDFLNSSFKWFKSAEVAGVLTWMYWGCFIAYVGISFGTLFTDKFQREFIKSEKIRELRALNVKCMRLTNEVRKYLDFSTKRKLKKFLKDKNEILAFIYKGKISVIGEQVVEKFLKLLTSYIELLKNYEMRIKDVESINVEKIRERVALNKRKLDFTKDIDMNYTLRNSIEIDEKIIDRFNNERVELENIKTKLDYTESSISVLKQQILANYSENQLIGEINNAINEASAVEEVLDERRKNRMKI